MPRSIAAFQVLDVSEWEKLSEEPRGKRPKFWIKGKGREWLRKSPRTSRPFEPAVEVTTLAMARAAGLPAPDAVACTWTEKGRAQRGIVAARFLDESYVEVLTEGIQLLRGQDPSYDPSLHGEHTLARIRAALAAIEQQYSGSRLLQSFADVLTFDAWIGNSDRHQENWGLIASPHSRRLAPIYDTAACLGVELQPTSRLLTDPDLRRVAGPGDDRLP